MYMLRFLVVMVLGAFAVADHESISGSKIRTADQLSHALLSLSAGPILSFTHGYTSLLSAIEPSPTPMTTAEASSRLAAVYSAYPKDFYGAAAAVLLSGMTGESSFGKPLTDVKDFGKCNTDKNSNKAPSAPAIYPRAATNDPKYTVSETELRESIYFPDGFKKGAVQPALFFHGTGEDGSCENFATNLGKLFDGSTYADPVYVNVPTKLLEDEQLSSEYVAYAVHYVSAITGHGNVSVIAWSAGTIVTQWAFKYWPSIRPITSDYIAISPDYHGTVLDPVLCPPLTPCAPALLQQEYNSTFIQTLRANGGANAYVPTTEIHSIFDEIVQPQQDPGASGFLGGGATNVQIQNVCGPSTPAGAPNLGHEAALYNPVTYAVVKDALTHPGPANIKRSGAQALCGEFLAPGLSLSDVFAVEALLPIAGFSIATYPHKQLSEPPIRPYAASDAPTAHRG